MRHIPPDFKLERTIKLEPGDNDRMKRGICLRERQLNILKDLLLDMANEIGEREEDAWDWLHDKLGRPRDDDCMLLYRGLHGAVDIYVREPRDQPTTTEPERNKAAT